MIENTSGIVPTRFNVLVKPERAGTRNEKGEEITEGGIVLPKEVVESERVKQVRATIIALGPRAFEDGLSEEIDGEKYVTRQHVEPGQRVLVEEFSGYTVVGEDGEAYVMLVDKQIFGFVTGERDES